MNWKKTISGILAAALIVTSVAPGTAAAVSAAEEPAGTYAASGADPYAPTPIAHYAFDGDLRDSVNGTTAAASSSNIIKSGFLENISIIYGYSLLFGDVKR